MNIESPYAICLCYTKEKGGKNMRNKLLDCIALTIAIIGAINWGLIGFLDFNLVAAIFGNALQYHEHSFAIIQQLEE